MRSYGITNAAPWASAPPVGLVGDTYWNTTTKTLYVSDGAQWIPWPAGGGTPSLDSGWHWLDAFGEPALGSTYNRYDPSGKNWPPGRFRRDAAGCVYIELMLSGMTGTAGQVLFTLPVGFRPKNDCYLACPMGGSGQAVIVVSSNGNVTVFAGSTAANWLQISVSFMADDAQTIPWVPISPLTAGWIPWTAGSGSPEYFVDNAGDIHFRGGITGGLTGAANPFFVLPSDLAPAGGTVMFDTCAGPMGAMGPAQHARVDINTAGNMLVSGYSGSGTNGFVSLDGLVLSNPKGYWFAPALLASWVPYAGGFAPPGFCINKNGILAIRGLMKGGTVTAPTTIVAADGIPMPPTYQQAFLVGANPNAISRIDMIPDGSMQVVGFFNGGTNGYTSWMGRYFTRAAPGGG